MTKRNIKKKKIALFPLFETHSFFIHFTTICHQFKNFYFHLENFTKKKGKFFWKR